MSQIINPRICGNIKLIKIRQQVGILDVRTNKWILGRVREIDKEIKVSNESDKSHTVYHTLYSFDFSGVILHPSRDNIGFRLCYCSDIPASIRYGDNPKRTLEYIIDSYIAYLTENN